MTDIVERLRGYAGDDHERGCEGRYYTCSCGYDDKRDPLLAEAINEITQLRAVIQRIYQCSAQKHVIEMARVELDRSHDR